MTRLSITSSGHRLSPPSCDHCWWLKGLEVIVRRWERSVSRVSRLSFGSPFVTQSLPVPTAHLPQLGGRLLTSPPTSLRSAHGTNERSDVRRTEVTSGEWPGTGRHAIHLSSRFLSQSFILRPLESHASYSRSLPSSLRSSRMEGDVRRLTTVTYGEARDGNDQGNSRFAHPSSRYVTPSVVLPPLVHLRPPDRRSRVDEVSERREWRTNRGTNVTRNRSHLLHSSCRPVSLRSLFVLSSGHVTRATCEGDAAVGLVSKPEGNSRH